MLALLCLLYLILFVNRVNISTAAPLMRADLNLSNTQLGLVFSAFAIPYALFQLIGGWIGDKFGPRLTLSLCCAVVGISTVLTGAVRGFVWLFVLRVALGFGEGAAFPTATSAMSRWTPAGSLGIRTGDHALVRTAGERHHAADHGGAAAVYFVARLVCRAGVIELCVACRVGRLFSQRSEAHPAITEADLAALPAVTGARRKVVPWWPLARRILPVTIVDFCYGWTLWLFLSWIPSFFFENYHLNLQSSAMFSGGVLFAGVIGDAMGGLATDRLLRMTGSLILARRAVIVTGFLGAFVFLVPVILIHDLRVAAICLSLAFFFAELIVAPIWSIPMDIAPRYAGSASGMMNFGFGVAGLVSPSSFGYLVDRTGSWVVPFIGSIALLLLGAVLALRLRPDQPFVEGPVPARL